MIPKIVKTLRPAPTPTLTAVPVVPVTVIPDTLEPTISPSPFFTQTPALGLTQTANSITCAGAPAPIVKIGDTGRVATKITKNTLAMHKEPKVIGDDSPICILDKAEKTQFVIIGGPVCAQCQTECIDGATKPFNVWMWKIRISEDAVNSLPLCGSTDGWIVEGDAENYYIKVIPK
jgi:hypothetical protein